MVAVCSGLGRKKLTHFIMAAVCFPDPGTHMVLWRSCSQSKRVTSNEDLLVPMENLYKEPLKKCILCRKRVGYKNVQLLSQFIFPFTGYIHGRHITGFCGKKQKEITNNGVYTSYKQVPCISQRCESKLYNVMINKLVL